MTSPPAPPCTLANLESRRFGDTWPIECAGVTLSLDQQVANFNNADLTGGHFEGFKLETDFNIDLQRRGSKSSRAPRRCRPLGRRSGAWLRSKGACRPAAAPSHLCGVDGRSAGRPYTSCPARSSEYFRQIFLL